MSFSYVLPFRFNVELPEEEIARFFRFFLVKSIDDCVRMFFLEIHAVFPELN